MGYINCTIRDAPLYIHYLARERLRFCQTIVDIGCGIGRLAAVFPQAKLVGIDLRSNAQVCLQRGYSEFHLCDLENGEVPSMDADGMVCSHVLEHFLRPELALRNALNALQPGGVVYVVCPTLNNAKYWDDYTHVRPFTEHSMRGLLQDEGLKDVKLLHNLKVPFRGAGRLLKIWTRGDPKLEWLLATRFPSLRANVNVHALCIYPGRDENKV